MQRNVLWSGAGGQVKTHMITLNSCYVFICLFTCILPLLPYSLASGGWCVHYIKGSCVIWILVGFWWRKGSPGQRLERRAGRETEVKVLRLLGPSFCGCSLDWRSSHSQDSAGLFPGTGTSPLPIPLGLDTGSYTVSWGFSTATSCFVICFFLNKSSLEHPQWSVPTALWWDPDWEMVTREVGW